MGEHVDANGTTIWIESRGQGPDVLLIAGLSDPAEAWQAQLDGLSDRYRVITFDNRGSGRTPLPDGPMSVAMMADDAAEVLRVLRVDRAHVVGFSGGSAIAQELALRHPEAVRSLVLMSTWARADAYFTAMTRFWNWLVTEAPDERAMLEAFFLWIYTPRAHADGTVQRIIDETLAFPYPQSAEAFQRQLEPFMRHDTLDRLSAITAPTLVLAGERDIATPPRLGRVVADAIPGARFEVMAEEAHQPFQESPDVFNARVEDFWREVVGGTLPS
ncbi:alpha/beta fold hydrolase [Streptomyces swartbergensis]|uniref:Alpha/beta hydrolase n=1 Tax=Streptomyces swartbergensis TaxID=487165 RepID=A0A243RZ21_9ACTN|nr:alpha/beta fold hydrolase [Streptomyces swartbergensis]OUD00415.1 alpha/beta hydrolase [Streptomyces swartbergensis]